MTVVIILLYIIIISQVTYEILLRLEFIPHVKSVNKPPKRRSNKQHLLYIMCFNCVFSEFDSEFRKRRNSVIVECAQCFWKKKKFKQ